MGSTRAITQGDSQKQDQLVKTLKAKKWRRGQVTAKCDYCHEEFIQFSPWQKYCCDSHRVMAFSERKEKGPA